MVQLDNQPNSIHLKLNWVGKIKRKVSRDCYWPQPNCHWPLWPFKHSKFTLTHNSNRIMLPLHYEGAKTIVQWNQDFIVFFLHSHCATESWLYYASWFMEKMYNRITIPLCTGAKYDIHNGIMTPLQRNHNSIVFF